MRRVALLSMILGCKPTLPAPHIWTNPVVSSSLRRTPVLDPNGDFDADSIPNAIDRCPEEPEDRDGFEDENGCVDRDNDDDGVLDAYQFKDGRWTNCDYTPGKEGIAVDCRNWPEDLDGIADHDGCPDINCFDDCQIMLTGKLHFDRDGQFDGDTAKHLDDIAATMQTVPKVRFWVDVHFDAQSDPVAAKRLTESVIEVVTKELARRGVGRDRLEPRAWGAHTPIADNRSAAGRAANRRVEFVRIEGCPCSPPSDPRPEGVDRCL